MEVLRGLGFDPILFTAQIVNFLVILFILKKILYKPLLEMLNKRQAEIKSGLDNKEKAEALLLDTEEKEKKVLKKANETAKNILSDADKVASEIKAKAEISAKKESEKIILDAKATVSQEVLAAENKLTEKIGSLSLSLLQKSLVGVFGENEQKTILKKAETEIKKQQA